ncbi:MAG: autolysin sensor kinase [Proteobacteria bacterium]|jgi:Histidine kinase|nr:autolysin sensor kinase [Pseudomonadota bacterium]
MSSLHPSLPGALAPSGHSPWRRAGVQLLRGGAMVLVLNLAIATLLTVGGLGPFKSNLVVSMCIGLVCWLIIDGGRHAVAVLRDRWRAARGLPPGRPFGFPGWHWLLALCALGLVLGPVLGNLLAAQISGDHIPGLWPFAGSGTGMTWLLTLLASAIAVLTLSLLERLSHARADAEAARRVAAENQLKLLESQLEPHMLFNTLANLRVLIAMDPPRAQAMLDRLIAFLRATLNASRSSMHPLATEFERIGDYLALMGVRMGQRLQTQLSLPEELRAVGVPPLLLQPLVENSIKHGLEPKVAGGRIEVSARRDGDMLVLSVLDSGVGLGSVAPASHTRFGLQQVRERLHTLYGSRAGLELQEAAGGGTLARIRLPLPL